MKIAIIGTGYVGTVAGACFADAGHSVICVDRDVRKIEALSSGSPVIYEPGLEDLLGRNLKKNRIEFTTSLPYAVQKSQIIFMTVGTPSLATGEANLVFLREAVLEVASCMKDHRIVVNKSTVPVGTFRKVEDWISSKTKCPFDVVSNPEFLREGAAIHDFLHPERVVVGTKSAEAFQTIKALYQPFVRDLRQILRMDPTSAELTKYACNAFLATRISFINELAGLCEELGGDIESIRQGMGLDSRIGPHFLNAGIGYGGSCFPKDIRALLSLAHKRGIEMKIIKSVEEVNERQKGHLLNSILARFGSDLSSRMFGVWGLAFKPETDDIREAPACVMIDHLLSRGAKIRAYDPVALENAKQQFGTQVEFVTDPFQAIHQADALIIATEWKEFQRADLERIKNALKSPVIFDGRNIFNVEAARSAGLEYTSIGRSPIAERGYSKLNSMDPFENGPLFAPAISA